MSNLIKGYMVNYPNSVKTLDMNERSESYRQLYLEALEQENQKAAAAQNLQDFLIEEGEAGDESLEGEFRAGLYGEELSIREDAGDGEYDENADGRILAGQQKIKELKAKLEELRREAAAIMDNANDEAARIIEEAKAKARAEAEEEKSRIIGEYKQQGYEAGMADAESECEELKRRLNEQMRLNNESYEKQVREMEPAFVEVLINLLQKITGVYAQERTEVIMHVVHQALTKQTPCRNFIIRVSPQDYGTILNSKPEILLWVPEGSQIEVVEDKMLEIGDCLIETDSRIFDCGVDTQLMAIIEDIRILAATETEP